MRAETERWKGRTGEGWAVTEDRQKEDKKEQRKDKVKRLSD